MQKTTLAFLSLMLLLAFGCGKASKTARNEKMIIGKWSGDVYDEKGNKSLYELEFTKAVRKDESYELSYSGNVKYTLVMTPPNPVTRDPGKRNSVSGRYTINGDKLTLSLTLREQLREYTITELTEDHLVLVNEKNDEIVFYREN